MPEPGARWFPPQTRVGEELAQLRRLFGDAHWNRFVSRDAEELRTMRRLTHVLANRRNVICAAGERWARETGGPRDRNLGALLATLTEPAQVELLLTWAELVEERSAPPGETWELLTGAGVPGEWLLSSHPRKPAPELLRVDPEEAR